MSKQHTMYMIMGFIPFFATYMFRILVGIFPSVSELFWLSTGILVGGLSLFFWKYIQLTKWMYRTVFNLYQVEPYIPSKKEEMISDLFLLIVIAAYSQMAIFIADHLNLGELFPVIFMGISMYTLGLAIRKWQETLYRIQLQIKS